MRGKIGLCSTDDLISIFRDLGVEMTLFTFKCFALAPGLLYLCLIPPHRQNPPHGTESRRNCSGPSEIAMGTRQTVRPRTSKTGAARPGYTWREERVQLVFLEVTFIFLLASSDLMHALEAESGFQKAPVFRDNLQDVWHFAFRSTAGHAFHLTAHIFFDPELNNSFSC